MTGILLAVGALVVVALLVTAGAFWFLLQGPGSNNSKAGTQPPAATGATTNPVAAKAPDPMTWRLLHNQTFQWAEYSWDTHIAFQVKERMAVRYTAQAVEAFKFHAGIVPVSEFNAFAAGSNSGVLGPHRSTLNATGNGTLEPGVYEFAVYCTVYNRSCHIRMSIEWLGNDQTPAPVQASIHLVRQGNTKLGPGNSTEIPITVPAADLVHVKVETQDRATVRFAFLDEALREAGNFTWIDVPNQAHRELADPLPAGTYHLRIQCMNTSLACSYIPYIVWTLDFP